MKQLISKLVCCAAITSASLFIGCAGNEEIKPDQVQTPEVDQAAVQAERDRAKEMMKQHQNR